MAGVIICGVRQWDFTPPDSKRSMQGMHIHYHVPLVNYDDDGLLVQGYRTNFLKLRGTDPLYLKMLEVDFSEPFEAAVQFDLMPDRKEPVLTDIIF